MLSPFLFPSSLLHVVALLFIVSAFKKLGKIFAKHPLTSVFGYCASLPEIDACLEDIKTQTNNSLDLSTITGAPFYSNITEETSCSLPDPVTGQPNTALLSMFFMLGTFFIAYFLRIMRTSHYMGKNVGISNTSHIHCSIPRPEKQWGTLECRSPS